MVVGGLKPYGMPSFKWVNAVLGNLKTTRSGGSHTLKFRKYGRHYLAGFAHRITHRFDLLGLVARLVVDVMRAEPIKEKNDQLTRRGTLLIR